MQDVISKVDMVSVRPKKKITEENAEKSEKSEKPNTLSSKPKTERWTPRVNAIALEDESDDEQNHLND